MSEFDYCLADLLISTAVGLITGVIAALFFICRIVPRMIEEAEKRLEDDIE